MSEQRERMRKALARDLRAAVDSTIANKELTTDRWEVVSERINLLIDVALLDQERASQGKRAEHAG
jgi:hypothetical protein